MAALSEFDRRLVVAIEAARNVAAARGHEPDLAAVRHAVLAGLDAGELVAVVRRGLAGDSGAKEALSLLLLRLAAQLQDLEAKARLAESGLWLDGPSQPGKSEPDQAELEAPAIAPELHDQAPPK